MPSLGPSFDELMRKAHATPPRGSSRDRGYTWQWEKARAVFLLRRPLCVLCERAGTITAATVVDHISPHRGDMVLFWDEENWQPLCRSHHDLKTAAGA